MVEQTSGSSDDERVILGIEEAIELFDNIVPQASACVEDSRPTQFKYEPRHWGQLRKHPMRQTEVTVTPYFSTTRWLSHYRWAGRVAFTKYDITKLCDTSTIHTVRQIIFPSEVTREVGSVATGLKGHPTVALHENKREGAMAWSGAVEEGGFHLLINPNAAGKLICGFKLADMRGLSLEVEGQRRNTLINLLMRATEAEPE